MLPETTLSTSHLVIKTFDTSPLWQCRATILADDGSSLTVETQHLNQK